MDAHSDYTNDSVHPVLGDGGGMFFMPSLPAEDTEMHGTKLSVSSVAILYDGHSIETNNRHESSWDDEEMIVSKRLTSCQMLRLCIDSVVLVAIAMGIVLAAYFPVDMESGLRYGGILPYVYAIAVAIAGYEYAWLAYRVHLNLFMPCSLSRTKTSREMYRQLIAHAVNIQTSAVTRIAEKVFAGKKVVAALVISIVATGGAMGLCFGLGRSAQLPMVYIGVCTFVGTASAALAPTVPTAVCVMIRYVYFFLSSFNVMLRAYVNESTALGIFDSNESDSIEDFSDGPNIEHTMDNYLAVLVESYSLLLLGMCLLFVVRAVTSKNAMDSALMIVLDVAGLLYLSCSSDVLQLFEQSTRVRASGALAGFFFIVWSAELGAFFTAHILKAVHFPWMHPLSAASSQQNVEKLIGAIGCAVGGAMLATKFVKFDMKMEFVALVSAAAVVCAHVGKLFLVSLKKVASVSKTGSYLRVGGGVLDCLDTLLFMAIVFAPVFNRALYNQPQL